jgi:hypothetical protein
MLKRVSPKNLELLKKDYLEVTINQLTVKDIYVRDRVCWCRCICTCGVEKEFRLSDVLRNRNKSCGCANSSEVMSNRHKQFWKDNPDKLSERAAKYSQWCKDNPDKLLEKSQKTAKYYEDHPELRDHIGSIVSSWYKNNPDKVKEKCSKFSKWCENNKDKVKAISFAVKEAHQKRRKESITSDVLSVIHPDDVDKLVNGDFHSRSDHIRSKCPICGNYDDHPVQYIISFKKKLLRDHLPMCNACHSSYTTSMTEQEIADYISTIYSGECIRNSRNIISPLELDLYYPEKKIAVEFNGLYWHSDKFKENNYHFNKFKLCRENNIRLISIFEQDWLYKQDRVKEILDDAFKLHTKISARKCIVSLISSEDRRRFIDKYHFDGDSYQTTISYGLFYSNELVSVMSFGKLRGQNKLRSRNGYYELVRFVTKSSYTVVGGASKLFKHFIRDYNPEYILCYSDNDFFTGEVYLNLGFTSISLGERLIDYQWCNCHEALSRYACMPFKLLNKYPQYKDVNIEGSKERFIMEDLGYFRVYRCGNSIWEWKR